GACVLWDCVPSKTLLTSAQAFNTLETAPSLGVHFEDMQGQEVPRYEVDLPTIMTRVRDLALAQSEDISKRVLEDGVRVVLGRGRIADPHTVEVVGSGGTPERIEGGGRPCTPPSAPRPHARGGPPPPPPGAQPPPARTSTSSARPPSTWWWSGPGPPGPSTPPPS